MGLVLRDGRSAGHCLQNLNSKWPLSRGSSLRLRGQRPGVAPYKCLRA